ncbi:MAG: F-type H+-transporting ATPase subunit epsilon [Patescibacteria group bacterium]|nr:F-type H+-transporting ATPase subunit epsilon [Patescibacteria group bacterium]
MAAKKTIQFEIVTLQKVVLRQEITQLTVPTKDGEITVLPEHIPLVSVLKPGVIETRDKEGETEIMSISGGFIEVLRDKIVILADSAERAFELNEDKVLAARKKAEEEKLKAETDDHYDLSQVAIKLESALAREKALQRWRRLKNK